MQLLRSILFTCVLFLSVIPFALVVILVRPLGFSASVAVSRSWAYFINWTCKILCGLSFSIEGRENIPDQPCVVFLKHSSAYETIVQWLILPSQTWVLKRELMWTPFFGWALACLSPIAIDRGSGKVAVNQVIQQGKQQLAEGRYIMIFPEGTRMPVGETRRYGISGTLLAQEAETLILPIAHTAGHFWPRRGWLKRRGHVVFSIGKPVNPKGREPRTVNDEIQSWIEKRITEIL